MGNPEVVEVTEGLTGEIAQLRVVTLGFELGDDDDRDDDVVFVEPGQRRRVSEQDAGVEDVGTTLHRVGHSRSPGRRAESRHRGQDTPRPGSPGTNVSNGPGLPTREDRCPLVARSESGGLPRGHPGEVPAISESTHDWGSA